MHCRLCLVATATVLQLHAGEFAQAAYGSEARIRPSGASAGRPHQGLLRRSREFSRRLDERVDDLSGAGVAVAGWKECVDVTPAYALLDRAYGDAAVIVDEEARYPADAD